MKIALVTGSSGLIGGESVEFMSKKFDLVIGIDNDMRAYFFGNESSTNWNKNRLEASCSNFKSYQADIRSVDALSPIFEKYGNDIALIIHTAAQPSHDWAAREPLTDFGVNATGTINLLEMCRLHCPEAVLYLLQQTKYMEILLTFCH